MANKALNNNNLQWKYDGPISHCYECVNSFFCSVHKGGNPYTKPTVSRPKCYVRTCTNDNRCNRHSAT